MNSQFKILVGGKEYLLPHPNLGKIRKVYGLIYSLHQKPSAVTFFRLIALVFGRKTLMLLIRHRLIDVSKALLAYPKLLGLEEEEKKGGYKTECDAWDLLYFDIARYTGWSKKQIDEDMTLPMLKAMRESIELMPPAEALLAAFLEYKPPQRLRAEQEAMLDDLFGMG